MKYNQLNPLLTVFRAIVTMEDDIQPVTDQAAQPATKREALVRAIKEKAALVKRTHKAALDLLLDYNAKPTTFKAADVYDVLWDEATAKITFVTCKPTTTKETVSHPSGVVVLNMDAVIDAQLHDCEEAFSAAISNVALAPNPSQQASRIVQILGLEDVVRAVKATSTPEVPAAGGGMSVMWFPINGWTSNVQPTMPYVATSGTAFDTPAATELSEAATDFELPEVIITSSGSTTEPKQEG